MKLSSVSLPFLPFLFSLFWRLRICTSTSKADITVFNNVLILHIIWHLTTGSSVLALRALNPGSLLLLVADLLAWLSLATDLYHITLIEIKLYSFRFNFWDFSHGFDFPNVNRPLLAIITFYLILCPRWTFPILTWYLSPGLVFLSSFGLMSIAFFLLMAWPGMTWNTFKSWLN